MSRYATLTELAKELGVAPSTVSRALTDHPRISKKTRELIQAKAREVGYIPNKYSEVLKTRKSYLIGVIVPDITLHFYARVMKSIQEVFRSTGYSILLGDSSESSDREAALVDKFLASRVDGVLSALSIDTVKLEHYEKLINQEVPLVFYDRVANFLPVPKIVSDDYRSAYNATKYLIDSGCKRIAHITASKNLNNSNNRLYGYLDALKDGQLESDESLVFYYEFDHSLIIRFLDDILKEYPDLDGVFVFNDYVANTVVRHLLAKGKRVPEEISVIGFSGEPVATYMTPQLSTLEDIAAKMGTEASMQLIRLIDSGQPDDRKTVLPQDLILRGTTK